MKAQQRAFHAAGLLANLTSTAKATTPASQTDARPTPSATLAGASSGG